jgi:hypothetical protein
VRFLWANGLSAKDIHKEIFPAYCGSVCRVKRFTTESRNSLRGVRKLQMMPDQVALLRLRQKQMCSARVLTVFWDFQRVPLAHVQKRGENVNSASYCVVLLKLRDAIRGKRSGRLARGVQFHHDYARPHTARATQERIQELIVHWELLEHPPYSLYLAPNDFHLFGPPKNHFGGKRFADDRRSCNRGAEVAETIVKILQCCRFRRTGKAMGQVYQCWWRICQEINVFFFFQIRI